MITSSAARNGIGLFRTLALRQMKIHEVPIVAPLILERAFALLTGEGYRAR
jgi:hypothetical protein